MRHSRLLACLVGWLIASCMMWADDVADGYDQATGMARADHLPPQEGTAFPLKPAGDIEDAPAQPDATRRQTSSEEAFLAEELLPLDLEKTDADAPPAALPSGDNLTWLGFKAACSLGLVLILVLVAMAGMKKWMGGPKRTGGESHMRVLQRLGLNPKQSVYLLGVGQRILVVGGTPERLDTLAEITDPDEIAGFHHDGAARATPFQKTLEKAAQPFQGWRTSTEHMSGGMDDMNGLQTEVGRIRMLMQELKKRASSG